MKRSLMEGPGWKVHPLIVMGVNPYGWSVPKDWIGVRFGGGKLYCLGF